MHSIWLRIAGTIALTFALAMLLFRGLLRDDDMSVEVALGGVVFVAIFAYRFWPSLDVLWEGRIPYALTRTRDVGFAGAGLLLTPAIVFGGKVFSLDLDPWLVLAFLVLAALLSFVTDWEDTTIQWRSRG